MRGNYQVRFCGGRGAAMLFSPTHHHHPLQQVILILTLAGESYQEQTFTGSAAIVSPAFPALSLSADQVLRAGL
jgi:Uma2 family endonuclease